MQSKQVEAAAVSSLLCIFSCRRSSLSLFSVHRINEQIRAPIASSSRCHAAMRHASASFSTIAATNQRELLSPESAADSRADAAVPSGCCDVKHRAAVQGALPHQPLPGVMMMTSRSCRAPAPVPGGSHSCRPQQQPRQAAALESWHRSGMAGLPSTPTTTCSMLLLPWTTPTTASRWTSRPPEPRPGATTTVPPEPQAPSSPASCSVLCPNHRLPPSCFLFTKYGTTTTFDAADDKLNHTHIYTAFVHLARDMFVEMPDHDSKPQGFGRLGGS